MNNLIIISGNGSKSGKTTIACRIISQFRHLEPVAIKTTPHFHELTPGVEELLAGEGYSIRIEKNPDSGKDTSRMLASGASRVYLLLAWDAPVMEAFLKVLELIPEGTPVICESTSLRDYIEPGLFLIIGSEEAVSRQDLTHQEEFPHLKYTLKDSPDVLKINFSEGSWRVEY